MYTTDVQKIYTKCIQNIYHISTNFNPKPNPNPKLKLN